MQLSILKAAALAAAFQTTSATPIGARSGGLEVMATTTTADGRVIDWVVPESQTGDQIASAPPAPSNKRGLQTNHASAAIRALLERDPGAQGPNGTVPIPRTSRTTAPKGYPSTQQDASTAKINAATTDYTSQHWYASSGQAGIDNHGGKGTFSLFDAFVEHDTDFSLLQLAVVRKNASNAGLGLTTQTVEAGWINYPSQVSAPHLFSYYTTNGYTANGDNVGGWNREDAGWVQTDSQIYPGFAFTPFSVDGGDQHEMEIGYQLKDGNWWLWCMDRYIGYYPGSLFSQGVDAADTLADHSNYLAFYGEIFNSQAALTTTDMGSGEFPDAGKGKSAYIHNIQYIGTDNSYQAYNGQGNIQISDTSRYNMIPSWNSGTNWGSYFYLGGPGAGGQIGA